MNPTENPRIQLAPPAPISALAWSSDDTALALGAADGTVCVWERTQ